MQRHKNAYVITHKSVNVFYIKNIGFDAAVYINTVQSGLDPENLIGKSIFDCIRSRGPERWGPTKKVKFKMICSIQSTHLANTLKLYNLKKICFTTKKWNFYYKSMCSGNTGNLSNKKYITNKINPSMNIKMFAMLMEWL